MFFIVSFLLFLFLEIALPDLVTKFIPSSPTKNVPPPVITAASKQKAKSAENMEFLIPHIPAMSLQNTIPTTSATPVTSIRDTAATNVNSNLNGNILQSAINSLNSQNHFNTNSTSTNNNNNYKPNVHIQTSINSHHLHHNNNNNNNNYNSKKLQAVQQQPQQQTSVVVLKTQKSVPGVSTKKNQQPPSLPPPTLQQPPTNKMTKKQMKVAQAQLDKLTQINIHLHGMYSFVYYYLFIFSCCFCFATVYINILHSYSSSYVMKNG